MESSGNDKKLESYLWNELSDNEIAALEDELVRDDELFQRLETLQMNLIDSYLENEMTDDEKRRFEAAFLNNPANQWKLEEARVFRESLRTLREKQPAARKVAKSPIRFYQLAVAAVVLIIMAVVVVLAAIRWWNQQMDNMITQSDPSPISTIDPVPSPSPLPSPSITPTPKRTPGPPIHEQWLYLKETRTGVAGPDDDLHIKISPDTETLRLRFELLDDARALNTLRVSIKDQMDYPVAGPFNIRPVQIRHRGSLRRAISVDVPIAALTPGERYRFDIAEIPPPTTFVISR